MQKENSLQILKRHGIRPTPNRIMVLGELLRSDRPLGIGEIEGCLETLDKSSIFRTLVTFVEHGLLHSLEDGKGLTRYEICCDKTFHHDEIHADMHAHFYCERCGTVMCLPQVRVADVELPAGCQAKSVNYMIKGICGKCGLGDGIIAEIKS